VLAAGLVGAGLGVQATAASAPAQAAANCGNRNVSVYGVLADGRLTYTAIDPDNGNLLKAHVAGAPLGFTPRAMATLNFNTILLTSDQGDLYRVDVVTNDTSLGHHTPVKVFDRGWTHDKLTFDGHGHLYGTAAGKLIRYNVSQAKPGPAHIGGRTEIDTGFTLRTIAASGDDRLIATANDGRLLAYAITGADRWSSAQLDDAGWGGFTHLLSPGGGLYYGRTADGAMYWYEDDNPADGSGRDIGYHLNDPVSSRGWTQRLLSAQPAVCTATPPANPVRRKIADLANDEVGTGEASCDRYHPSCDQGRLAWCAMFATWTWEKAGVRGVPRSMFVARGLGKWGRDHDLFKPRPSGGVGSPKVGDWVIYGPPDGDVGGHVDVVVQVRPDGDLVVVGGNLSNAVRKRTIDPRTARSGDQNLLISGYVSPPGAP